jgi:hypothetical protein
MLLTQCSPRYYLYSLCQTKIRLIHSFGRTTKTSPKSLNPTGIIFSSLNPLRRSSVLLHLFMNLVASLYLFAQTYQCATWNMKLIRLKALILSEGFGIHISRRESGKYQGRLSIQLTTLATLCKPDHYLIVTSHYTNIPL